MRTSNNTHSEGYRRHSYNPLFDAIVNELDKVLQERSLSDAEVLNKLYVDKRTNDVIVSENLFRLWTNPAQSARSAFELTSAFSAVGSVYLLLGKKGTGKTITLKSFISHLEKKSKSKKNTDIIYLNVMSKKSDYIAFLNRLPESLMEEIFFTIKRDHTELFSYLSTPEKIKEVEKPLYDLETDKEVVKKVIDDKSRAIEETFHYLSEQLHREIYLIIDNLDDLPITSIKAIIDKCVGLTQFSHIKCIIALRDYWNRHNLHIEDKNICAYYLTKPDIFEILKKRLEAIPIKAITHTCSVSYGKHELTLSAEDIINMYLRIVEHITTEKDMLEIHEKLYELANYDIREYLLNIYNFFHSAYLFSKPVFIKELIAKIKEIDKDFISEPILRKFKFFDFIENAMAVHMLCYDRQDSKIFNVFSHEYDYDDEAGNNYRNTLIFVRILQSLPDGHRTKKTSQIVKELTSIGYEENAIKDAIDTLLDKALIGSIQGIKESAVTDISISAKGSLYLNELIKQYTYLLFICDDVPMPDKYKVDISEKFGNEAIPLIRGNLRKKNESVHLFLDFIKAEEEAEKDACPSESYHILKRIGGIDDEFSTSYQMREDVNDQIRWMQSSKGITTTQTIVSFKIL